MSGTAIIGRERPVSDINLLYNCSASDACFPSAMELKWMKTLLCLALCTVGVATLQTSAALAQTSTNGSEAASALPPLQAIVWKKTPGKGELADYEPDRAQRTAQNGDSSMRCKLVATGSLTNCAVVAESPAGYGFGEAILKLAGYFKAEPFSQDRQVSVEVHWGWRGDRTISTEIIPAS